DLPRDDLGVVARGVLRHEEAADLTVIRIGLVVDARPHEGDAARRPVADPLLAPGEDPLVALPRRRRLEAGGVAAVEGLGERERPGDLAGIELREPRLLLLRG